MNLLVLGVDPWTRIRVNEENSDQGKPNLVRVSGEFELSE